MQAVFLWAENCQGIDQANKVPDEGDEAEKDYGEMSEEKVAVAAHLAKIAFGDDNRATDQFSDSLATSVN